jgi:hypothetical protein
MVTNRDNQELEEARAKKAVVTLSVQVGGGMMTTLVRPADCMAEKIHC